MFYRIRGSSAESTGPRALCSLSHRQHGELHVLPQVGTVSVLQLEVFTFTHLFSFIFADPSTGGYCWVSRESLNTVMPYVCLRSSVVTTWSSFPSKWNEPGIRKDWPKTSAQVTNIIIKNIKKCHNSDSEQMYD